MFRLLLLLGSLSALGTVAAAGEPDVAQRRQAVERALTLVQRSAVEFTKHRDCFSCHHQALGVLALTAAEGHGFSIDASILKAQVDWTAAFLKRNEQRYAEGQGQGGQADTAGYALWTLNVGKYPPDELLAAVCHYLLARHADRDHWECTSNRPPSEASHITTTFLAVQGLRRFSVEKQRPDVQRRLDQAREWLRAAVPADTEDRVFRLRALAACEVAPDVIAHAAGELWDSQRDDGGWSQLATLDSDAYATGSALAALFECGATTDQPSRRDRAIDWLLQSQRKDGSWHVATRSAPIQEYFETGFPHGKDQFISMAGTCWAVIALIRSLPESDDATKAPDSVPRLRL